MKQSTPHSASSLKVFDKCQQLYKYKYIDKIPVEESDPIFFIKGKFFHSMLENYDDVKKTLDEYKGYPQYKEWLESIKKILSNSKIQYLLKNRIGKEERINIRRDFSVAEQKEKDLLFTGFIDYIGTNTKKDTYYIVDWKTGKSTNAEEIQLKLYAMWFFLKNPDINNINCIFYYIEQDEYFETYSYNRNDLDSIIDFFKNKIDLIESIEIPEKKKNVDVCKYCEYFGICKPFKTEINNLIKRREN